jgi:dienelactone hydrolase
MLGMTVSHYRVLERVGEGGMGVVYKAEDTRLGRTVALKMVKAQYSERFEREARAIAALNHPNVCTLYDVGLHEGEPFLVMEYVEGAPPRSPLPPREAVACALQVAEGLAAAHAKHLIHRDLKPANVRVTPDGRAKILDFGLAKLVAPVDPEEVTQSAGGATGQGVLVGTLAYMSPEQAQGKPLDARSDVFSFGVLLYELLTGSQPFRRDSQVSTLAAILKDDAPPLEASPPGVPAALQRIVSRCLAKDSDGRYPSAAELAADLAAVRKALESAGPRRTLAVVPVLVLLAAMAAALGWLGLRHYRIRDAYGRVMPEVERLADAGDFPGALRLAQQVEAFLGQDPDFQGLLAITACPASVRTEPAGARVSWKPYVSPESDWRPLGSTPVADARVPRGLLRWRVEKQGFETLEFARGAGATSSELTLVLKLRPPGSDPPGMIWVPGGSMSYGYAGPARLDDFWLDRFEVSNREFKAFVDRGGYRTRDSWKHAFRDGGREVSFEAALAGFVDSTGRPGPASWELGTWREGQADHPVGGVSWYEAQAYCESVGKSLPTLYHWYKAAAPGGFADILRFANMGTGGSTPRGGRPSLTAFGAYDMAGNVKEWAWNEIGERRAILGGAWDDVSYMFAELDAHPPLSRRETFGIRCAAYAAPPDASATAPPARINRDFTNEKPVDDATFRLYRSLYSYDRTDLAPSVDGVDASHPHWRLEKVSYAAAYGGERVVAYLYLPRNATPPYQTVVYFPGTSAFYGGSFDAARQPYADFVVRSGRALLFPAYKGSYDRFVKGAPYDATAPAALRDNLTWWAKDLGRTVDYVASRPDLDASRLAYYGFSLGGCDALVCLAVEPRFKAAVLLAGGLHADHRYVPEDDPLNFVPRIRIPVLLIGGRDDFAHPLESAQKPLFALLGTPEADKRHVILDSGHVPPRGAIMKDILAWLDRYLGPIVPTTS